MYHEGYILMIITYFLEQKYMIFELYHTRIGEGENQTCETGRASFVDFFLLSFTEK
jgi:hypothetical protein